MVVDVQCIMESLANVAKCYHTKLITTDHRAKMEGETMHIQFDEHHALDDRPADRPGGHRQLPQPPGRR